MTDYKRLIQTWGPCFHLHIDVLGADAQGLHRLYTDRFNAAMKLRYLRRMRPIYLRMVNIEDHTKMYHTQCYRYISDIITPSMNLLCEVCGMDKALPVEVVHKKKLSVYQVTRCFSWPIRYESIDHRSVRIITPMHPLTVVSGILADHPDGIDHFQIGTSMTLYTSPQVNDDDYFKCDPMPFKYKRTTRFQPITFTQND